MKSRLSGALCACMFMLASLPVMESANAAIVSGVTDNGNPVLDLGSGPGLTYLEVHFNNLDPVWIDLDNRFAPIDPTYGIPTDQVLIRLYNDTGLPWTDFHFEFTDGIILSPIGIQPVTGALFNVQITETAAWLFFDPAETVALLDGQGIIGTQFDFYSMHLQPTVVPIPAAAWLFGSGLLGLIGIARKKAA